MKNIRSTLERGWSGILTVCVFGIMGLGFACSSSASKDQLSELLKEFRDPPAAYRSAPFWVWNTKMTKADVDRMLSDFKEQGCGGVFVTPRYGLITEYLSQEWFDLMAYSVERAKALGMHLWLYDENAYPSGFAGGLLPEKMPESVSDGVSLAPFHCMRLPENVHEMYLVLKRVGESFEDITARVEEFREVEGDYFMYRKFKHETSDWYAGFSYVDLLKKNVTEGFLDLTMQGYKKRLGEEFGKTIPGIFTDEPHINTPSNTIRWTEDLFSTFRTTYGYSLEPNLMALHGEMEGYRKVRHDYYKLLLTLFVERWAKPCKTFYTKENLQWTGHYWGHEWPRLGPCPDNMALGAWLDMPGVDLLFNRFDEKNPRAQFGNIRLMKEVRSVANQMGAPRVLAEIYGGAGWDLTFKDQKRLGDWAYVHGANFMNQHLSHTSYAGTRKYDYPPMFTSAAPWWSNYKVLNDYFARLSFLLSKGEQRNEILVLEPTTTLWMYSSYLGDSPHAQEIADQFHTLLLEMGKHQLESDLGSETLLQSHGKVKKNKLIVGQRAYSTVILPPMMENLERSTYVLLKQFVEQGGQLLSYALPYCLDGSMDAELASFFGHPSIKLLPQGDLQALKKALPEPEIVYRRSWAGNVYHMRRQYKDGQLLFLVNSDMDAAEELTLEMKAKAVVELDALSGKVYKTDYTPEKGVLHLRLGAAQSRLLFLSNRSMDAMDRPLGAHLPIAPVSVLSRQRLNDNCLVIDQVDLLMNGNKAKGLYVLEASDRIFKNAGFSQGNPWFMKIQFKKNTVRRDTFRKKGFSVFYHFQSDASVPLSGLKIAVERPHLYQIHLNGKPLPIPTQAKFFLDKACLLLPIGEHVRAGSNELELKALKFSVHAEIEPVYVVGDFDVKRDKTHFYLTKSDQQTVLGDWKDLGCPFYPFGMAYSREYVLSHIRNKQFEVRSKQWKGALAEVWVNGKKAGILFSNPFTLNVSAYVREGINRVELRVIGGMDNLIGPFDSDPKGLTEPRSWKNRPVHLNAADYYITPYGLWSDFELLSN